MPSPSPSAPSILSVSLSPSHSFSKHRAPAIHLLAGLGIEGDAHCGATVRHRYKLRHNPHAPNLTQVHLLSSEFLHALGHLGFPLSPGDLGENITSSGLDLISLPQRSLVHLGSSAVLEITGLRQPCRQMNALRPGLMSACFLPSGDRGPSAARSGVMAIVRAAGIVRPGDPIAVHLPPPPHLPLHFV